MAITFAKQQPPKSITAHYTPAELASRLVAMIPYARTDKLLDPAAGAERTFYAHFKCTRKAYCEITEGTNFLAKSRTYDWAISNPPYHLLWAFIDKTSRESRKGFGYLVNMNGFSSLTPRRLQLLEARGFHLRALHVCNVRRWFGRYYFCVFRKEPGPCRVTWDDKPW